MDVNLAELLRWRLILPAVFLALFWTWESWSPFFGWHGKRLVHAGRNLTITLLNGVALGVAFGSITVYVAGESTARGLGLLHHLPAPSLLRVVLALVLLDGWMYVWHRANHTLPFLWRFHRMHHSDNQMDVTSASRFHFGELAMSFVLRLMLIPLLGLRVWEIVLYELFVVGVTQFHHADISLGRADKWLRWLVVTPEMHKVHHSDLQPETDSNYSTVLSIWDRLARTFRLRKDPHTIRFGLTDYADPQWQTVWGMLKTPFRSKRSKS